MNTLEQLHDWPVDNVSAAVRDCNGLWHSYGDENYRYALASVTKLLSAVTSLIAVEEGVFELDDEIGPQKATVRHLLSHASGVGFDSREPEKPLETRRIYSSAAFDIVADAIAAETGMSFAEYMNEALLIPLGMKATKLTGSAGHGCAGSVADLRAFVEQMCTPTILHPSTVAEAMTVQFPGLNGVVPGYGMQRPADWGLGFEVYGRPKSQLGLWFGENMPPQTVGHFGQSGTFCWLEPASGCAAVVLTDRAFGDWAKPLWAKFNAELFEELNASTRPAP